METREITLQKAEELETLLMESDKIINTVNPAYTAGVGSLITMPVASNMLVCPYPTLTGFVIKAMIGLFAANAQKRARDHLMTYYNELLIKQNLRIRQLNEMIEKLKAENAENEDIARSLAAKLEELQAMLDKLVNYQAA